MKPGKVGGAEGSARTERPKIDLPQLLQKLVLAYHLDDFVRGGEVAALRIANIRASATKVPPEIAQHILFELPQMALRAIPSRGPLIKALVKTLGFSADPNRVVEYFSGGDLSGPLALPDTRHYVQVSDDPLIIALGSLPEEFLRALGLSELKNPRFVKMAATLPAEQREPIEQIISLAVPNLKYVRESIQVFAARPAMAGQADLCLAFFWATAPFLEMETVVKPGGFMVTVDVSNKDLKGSAKRIQGKSLPRAKEAQSFQPRNDLMDVFTGKLAETTGYKELNLRVVIYQKV